MRQLVLVLGATLVVLAVVAQAVCLERIGPPGTDGRDGRDGHNGTSGRDGTCPVNCTFPAGINNLGGGALSVQGLTARGSFSLPPFTMQVLRAVNVFNATQLTHMDGSDAKALQIGSASPAGYYHWPFQAHLRLFGGQTALTVSNTATFQIRLGTQFGHVAVCAGIPKNWFTVDNFGGPNGNFTAAVTCGSTAFEVSATEQSTKLYFQPSGATVIAGGDSSTRLSILVWYALVPYGF